jgi:hypothetical protein
LRRDLASKDCEDGLSQRAFNRFGVVGIRQETKPDEHADNHVEGEGGLALQDWGHVPLAPEPVLVLRVHVLAGALSSRLGRGHQTALHLQHLVPDQVEFLVKLLDQDLVRCRKLYWLGLFGSFGLFFRL